MSSNRPPPLDSLSTRRLLLIEERYKRRAATLQRQADKYMYDFRHYHGEAIAHLAKIRSELQHRSYVKQEEQGT